MRLKDTFLLANGDVYSPNSTGGSETKSISVNNLPPHKHTVNSAGTHTHSADSANATHNHSVTTSSSGGHTHDKGSFEITGTFGLETDSSTANLSGAFYRKTASVAGHNAVPDGDRDDLIGFQASRSWSGSTGSSGSHTHTVSISNGGSHKHTVSIQSAGSHTHTTNNTGGGLPLNIMPPYTTVYMWRRTA